MSRLQASGFKVSLHRFEASVILAEDGKHGRSCIKGWERWKVPDIYALRTPTPWRRQCYAHVIPG
jgi:hypothetical protein